MSNLTSDQLQAYIVVGIVGFLSFLTMVLLVAGIIARGRGRRSSREQE
jgi:hypothetical protein